MEVYFSAIEVLAEFIMNAAGLFITLWIVYSIREAVLDYMSPKCSPSKISTILPPSCYVIKPNKKPYDI